MGVAQSAELIKMHEVHYKLLQNAEKLRITKDKEFRQKIREKVKELQKQMKESQKGVFDQPDPVDHEQCARENKTIQDRKDIETILGNQGLSNEVIESFYEFQSYPNLISAQMEQITKSFQHFEERKQKLNNVIFEADTYTDSQTNKLKKLFLKYDKVSKEQIENTLTNIDNMKQQFQRIVIVGSAQKRQTKEQNQKTKQGAFQITNVKNQSKIRKKSFYFSPSASSKSKKVTFKPQITEERDLIKKISDSPYSSMDQRFKQDKGKENVDTNQNTRRKRTRSNGKRASSSKSKSKQAKENNVIKFNVLFNTQVIAKNKHRQAQQPSRDRQKELSAKTRNMHGQSCENCEQFQQFAVSKVKQCLQEIEIFANKCNSPQKRKASASLKN